MPLILNGKLKQIRKTVTQEYVSGLKKIQTDLDRFKNHKVTVIQNSSAADAVDTDLELLNQTVGDLDKALADGLDARKKQLLKTMNRLVSIEFTKNLDEGQARILADQLDHLCHDPIANSKNIFNNGVRDINKQLET